MYFNVFIPIKHYSLLLMIFTFMLPLFIVHNKPKCEFFPELCQKKKHYESILNIENHDEVMTVNTGDSRTEGANEIISFPFEKWLTKVDSNTSFSPASLKTIQRDCPSVTQQISIENFQTSKHYAYEIKAKRMLCMNPEAQIVSLSLPCCYGRLKISPYS